MAARELLQRGRFQLRGEGVIGRVRRRHLVGQGNPAPEYLCGGPVQLLAPARGQVGVDGGAVKRMGEGHSAVTVGCLPFD